MQAMHLSLSAFIKTPVAMLRWYQIFQLTFKMRQLMGH
ncbi:hypothetical protein D1AOALGA4SA_12073 [Olavius algarvensis Delta 1 endosymbiont]|nr:hypothetical protein D1AOALGA4SA_12073 [Olavius algarvensis Delta 1 endosymbiont]